MALTGAGGGAPTTDGFRDAGVGAPERDDSAGSWREMESKTWSVMMPFSSRCSSSWKGRQYIIRVREETGRGDCLTFLIRRSDLLFAMISWRSRVTMSAFGAFTRLALAYCRRRKKKRSRKIVWLMLYMEVVNLDVDRSPRLNVECCCRRFIKGLMDGMLSG